MTGTTINPYRFGGQLGYRRDGANRSYVRARHLDTQRGRWISRDPIGFDGRAWNFYGYAGNNPLISRDPSGLKAKSVAFMIDDAPHDASRGTKYILNTLQQGYKNRKNIKAYFFVIGRNVDSHHDLMHAILQQNHVVGNHTQNHIQPFSTLTDAKMFSEFCQVHSTLLNTFGYRMHLYRAPGESRTDNGTQLAWDRIDKAAKRVDPSYMPLMENAHYPHTIFTLNDEKDEENALKQAKTFLTSPSTQGNVFMGFHDPVVSTTFLPRLFRLVTTLGIRIRDAK